MIQLTGGGLWWGGSLRYLSEWGRSLTALRLPAAEPRVEPPWRAPLFPDRLPARLPVPATEPHRLPLPATCRFARGGLQILPERADKRTVAGGGGGCSGGGGKMSLQWGGKLLSEIKPEQ